MRYSQCFPKTKREAPKEAQTANHKLLVRGGYIDQLMAGSWTLLPLGWRVISKITQIIREEMNAIGGQEMLMPLMHPKEIWQETGRWDSCDEIMYKLKDSREKDLGLGFTHEEIVLDLVRKHLQSYVDLPIKIYHFSTKFRNENRPQGGILRGREFLMKDLYSLHSTEEDFWAYYNKVKEAYLRIFFRVGLDAIVTEASGGVFTDKHTHEFQVITPVGEDTIYYDPKMKTGFNKEVLPNGEAGLEEARAVEVGNIFSFGTYYSEKMGITFTDKDGSKKPAWFGSYGIGQTRLMGVIAEIFHDDKGLIWPESVAPFKCHLIGLKGKGEDVYKMLGEDVLFDDRDVSAGEKFVDADLLGMPVRLVVSEKTLRQAQGERVEWKERASDKTELLSVEEVVKRLS